MAKLTTWDAENRPTRIARVSGMETYAYGADGERINRTAGFTTTVFLGGLWQEDVAGGVVGVTRVLYGFNGGTVAQRTHVTTPPSDSVVYLHGDHLGSPYSAPASRCCAALLRLPATSRYDSSIIARMPSSAMLSSRVTVFQCSLLRW